MTTKTKSVLLICALVLSIALNLIAGYYLWSFFTLFRTMLSVG